MSMILWPAGIGAAAACAALWAGAAAQNGEPGARPASGGYGEWFRVRQRRELIRLTTPQAQGLHFIRDLSASGGAWRCVVEVSPGTAEAGMWFQAMDDLSAGFLCILGGNPEVGGLRLQDETGTLWADEWAPWCYYEPYVLEGVVEDGKVRVQMFGWDGETLVSQSPWVEVAPEATARQGRLSLHASKGIGRFWGWEHAAEPLSPITDDAPNKRRLVQSAESEWVLLGTGNWMWTDAQKVRVRQYAQTERAWAISRAIRGAHREWSCRVRVSPGAGGAGMLFQTDEEAQRGFLCWLGGTWGAGCLMLYRLPREALWGGPENQWHYDTDYILQAATEPGQVQVRLLDGETNALIGESPRIEVPGEESAREGYLGLHTWKGSAEFWDFSEATAVAVAPTPGAEVAAGAAQPALGAGWVAFGEGTWAWLDEAHTQLGQTDEGADGSLLCQDIEGTRGVWRCRLTIPEGTEAAGPLFQTSGDMREGFLALLQCGAQGASLRLEDVAGRVLYEDRSCAWAHGTEYVLEGRVETDRVRVRLLAADGTTVIAESPAVYVSQANNERRGCLGFTTRGGPAQFWDWSCK